MPELPEVESVRRVLETRLVGRRVVKVRIRRADVVEGATGGPALLEGARIAELRRRGKQLAVIGTDGRAIVVHLGMTGQLIVLAPGQAPARTDHVHLEWELSAGNGSRAGAGSRMLFRDPRRFGGVRTFADAREVEHDWALELGPDALDITPRMLHAALRESKRAVKARLLDQGVIAGVGNIYADESLFEAGIRPRRASRSLKPDEVDRLAAAIRATLQRAIEAGGSTLRDFIGPDGYPGGYQDRHLVYGRGGAPCLRCGQRLRSALIGQRTTVWCPGCQR